MNLIPRPIKDYVNTYNYFNTIKKADGKNEATCIAGANNSSSR